MTIRVLHVAAELYPLLKTGGLADVVGALPPVLAPLGADARVIMPGFPAVLAGLEDLRPVAHTGPRFGLQDIALEFGRLRTNGTGLYVIRADAFYGRPGSPYLDAAHHPYADNNRRFALLGWAASLIAQGADPDWTPALVHAHDWHAGLAAPYIRAAEAAQRRRIAATVMTVHNLAYQGLFPASTFGELGLPAPYYQMQGMEFWGQVSYLKAGLFYSDKITTVSPTYANEIQTLAQGAGLDGLLRERAHDVLGILNGVDYAVWHPSTDPSIAAPYWAEDMDGKAACKRALQQRFGIAAKPDAPIFGVVSRLTEQKGLDLLLAALSEIVERGGQLVVLGTGEPRLEAGLKQAALAHPESVAIELGFDEALAHVIVAGSDVVCVPSRFEPCGLTQLYGLAYGALPLVHGVGGLADTVVDASLENLADGIATGFVFEKFDLASLTRAVKRVFALHARPDEWNATRRHGMKSNFGWEASALRYVDLYQRLVPDA
ncbi:glycogen synthase GlgA [Pararobbsia silviterrae]|uniref:Glycogen synthase n=1 Tax=Pararobbsia silviterrae TaxID=1792498 RepID=A0A494XZ67_9BURK|nr:glycogen synthase GlgA [Pararobbsia silviterrae]RKP53379.1 glycogen synthase GlgA [Pararobbsia silviterrae]